MTFIMERRRKNVIVQLGFCFCCANDNGHFESLIHFDLDCAQHVCVII